MKKTLNLQTNLAFATLGPKTIHQVSMNKGTGYSMVQNDTVTLHVQRQKREKHWVRYALNNLSNMLAETNTSFCTKEVRMKTHPKAGMLHLQGSAS